MKSFFKYIFNMLSKPRIDLTLADIQSLRLIALANTRYLRAHINTTSALMNSYPARSIKRKNMTKHLEKLQLKLAEQEADFENFSNVLKQIKESAAADR